MRYKIGSAVQAKGYGHWPPTTASPHEAALPQCQRTALPPGTHGLLICGGSHFIYMPSPLVCMPTKLQWAILKYFDINYSTISCYISLISKISSKQCNYRTQTPSWAINTSILCSHGIFSCPKHFLIYSNESAWKNRTIPLEDNSFYKLDF
jgi:hypothetical protein